MRIRNIVETDIPAVIGLLQEFAAFEKLIDFCEVTNEKLQAAMFGDEGFVEGLIADDGAAPAGHALFYPHFSSFRGQRGLYLEDIYIKPEYRGQGIGETMLKEIARIAASRGYERIDFQVLDWNTPAVRFYEKLGAVRDIDERHFKFTDAAFRSLAS
jgi:ribosomal protein S18 acetylase RimI-like enzyme